MNKCLYCYQLLTKDDIATDAGTQGYHRTCSTKFFGQPDPPRIDFSEEDILALAAEVIKSQRSVTGVQPKLSLDIEKEKGRPAKFTIVGLWGQYILKPPSEVYPQLPENEDLTMHLATLSGIRTVDHSLIRLRSGRLAYITRRIDREGNPTSQRSVGRSQKYHMEDMCQLTERLTEHKYKGSHEQIAKAIRRFSANPGLDIINYYELVLFCYLTGNNDMHLKNFSLLKMHGEYTLSPAYDLVATTLALPGDDEELALTMNSKKKKLTATDFYIAMQGAGISNKVIESLYEKYKRLAPMWHNLVDQSFLDEKMRIAYKEIIASRMMAIHLK